MKKLFSLLLVLFLTSCFVETSPEPYPSYLPSGTILEECSCYSFSVYDIGRTYTNYSCLSGIERVASCYGCCDWACIEPAIYSYCL